MAIASEYAIFYRVVPMRTSPAPAGAAHGPGLKKDHEEIAVLLRSHGAS